MNSTPSLTERIKQINSFNQPIKNENEPANVPMKQETKKWDMATFFNIKYIRGITKESPSFGSRHSRKINV